MGRHEAKEFVVDTLRKFNLRPRVVERKHLLIEWENSLGKTKQLFMSRTPSDSRRAKENVKRDLRKILKEDGFEI